MDVGIAVAAFFRRLGLLRLVRLLGILRLIGLLGVLRILGLLRLFRILRLTLCLHLSLGGSCLARDFVHAVDELVEEGLVIIGGGVEIGRKDVLTDDVEGRVCERADRTG